jgi:hypothetical protein
MKHAKAILSAVLILIVLVSSTSFTIGLHICGDEIQNVALFGKADGCEKEKQLPPCHTHETPACCQNETIVHTGDDDQFSTAGIQLPIPFAIHTSRIKFAITISVVSVEHAHRLMYDPPLRTCDLTVEHRTLLI